MTHGEVRTQLGDYLEGDLPIGRRALVDAHLDGCAACTSHLRELRSTVDALRALGDPEPPPGLADAVLARIEAGQGRPGAVARLLARIPWNVRTRLATPVVALASVFVLFVWLRPAGQRVAPLAPPPRPATTAARSPDAIDPARPIGASADLGEGASAGESPAGPMVPAADLDRALRDPAWVIERADGLDDPARHAFVEALARQAADDAQLRALAQALRQLPGPRAAALADAFEGLARSPAAH
jgi:anti-sigma factor RsiW